VGDFNFHVDNKCDPAAGRFIQLLESFNLQQHINVPTHGSGHTLDLIITRPDENIASNFSVSDPVISDHYVVNCTLSGSEENSICEENINVSQTEIC
jgi:endonuclease/exonuclease/phosphatase family metal-dependent hydrolase